MHPELSKELVTLQLEEALAVPGLFGPAVQLEEAGYPSFFVCFTTVTGVVRLLRFDCTNYDYQAMELEPVDPDTRAPLSRAGWVRRGGGEFPLHPRKDGLPFFCVQGVRSFYTYPGHDPLSTNEPWEAHRPRFRIVAMLRRIAEHFATGEWT